MMNVVQTWIEQALGYSVAWDDTAAWVQANGSILAIVASAFFAIWVPLHMESRRDRDAVQRAINSFLYAIDAVGGAWEALHVILFDTAWNASTPDLISDRIARASAMLEQTPSGMSLGTVYVWRARSELRLNTLELAMPQLAQAENPYALAVGMPITEVVNELAEMRESGRKLEPRRIAGHWMMYHPDDDADLAAAGARLAKASRSNEVSR